MKKALVIFGIILVFAGVIVASTSVIHTEESERSTVATAPPNEWEVSGPFNKGDMLSVEFVPPNLNELVIADSNLKLSVEVADSHGGKTVFEMEFSQTGFGGSTILKNLTIVSNEDGLTASNPPTEVGGIVPHTDDYSANITRVRVSYIAPGEGFWVPSNLKLVKEVVCKEYPYLFALPIGIILMVVGGCLSFWGATSSKQMLRARRKTP